MNLKRILFIAFTFLIVLEMPAFSYIDPGSTGLILQALIAGFVGSVVFLRQKFSVIKQWFKKKKKSNTE